MRRPVFDEGAALPAPAEPERLEPDHGEDAEPVVELGELDVAGRQLGAFPHARRRVARRHLGHVVELVPARPAPQGGADGVHVGNRVWRRQGRSRRCETMTAVDPSHGASQSNRQSGVEIIRAAR